MKFNTLRVLCILMLATSSLFAQNTTSSDDVYYNAASDGHFSLDGRAKQQKEYAETTEQPQGYNNANGLEDDDYYYSKRVRRFSNKPSSSGYYDPRYTDLYNYDPYYAQSAYSFGNDYYRMNMMQMNRWNSYAMLDWYNPYCSPFSRYGYTGNSYYFPSMSYGMGMGYGMGNGFYNPYRSNYGYGMPFYNTTSYASNNNANNTNANPKGTTFHPRTDGAVRSAPRNSGRGWNEGTDVRPNPSAGTTNGYGSPRTSPRQETATQGNVWGGRTMDNGSTETPRRAPRQSSYETQSQGTPTYSAPRSSGGYNSGGGGGSFRSSGGGGGGGGFSGGRSSGGSPRGH
jgi:hypothetical protein